MTTLIKHRPSSLAVLGLLIFTVPAWLLHEATHYVVARLVGCDAGFVWRSGDDWGPRTVVDVDAARVYWVPVIGLAPTLVGLCVALVWIYALGVPVLSDWGVVLGLLYYAVYTFPSRSDRAALRGGA